MKIPFYPLSVCILLLIFSPLAFGQDDSARARGHITTLWGYPIEKAEIAFYQLEGIHGLSPTEKFVKRAITNSRGHYELDGLPPGQYRVDVGFNGSGQAEIWRYYLWRGASRVLDIGISIGMTHHLSEIVLSGSVKQGNREPISEATVTLLNAFDHGQTQQLITDQKGRFRFNLIQPGQYIVYAAKPGFFVGATTVDLGNGTKESVNLVLKRGQPKYAKNVLGFDNHLNRNRRNSLRMVSRNAARRPGV